MSRHINSSWACHGWAMEWLCMDVAHLSHGLSLLVIKESWIGKNKYTKPRLHTKEPSSKLWSSLTLFAKTNSTSNFIIGEGTSRHITCPWVCRGWAMDVHVWVMHHHGWAWLVMDMSWIVNKKDSKACLHPKDPFFSNKEAHLLLVSQKKFFIELHYWWGMIPRGLVRFASPLSIDEQLKY